MGEGHFTPIRRMRLQYRDQRDALVTELTRRLGGHLQVDTPDQGMHLVAYSAGGLSDCNRAPPRSSTASRSRDQPAIPEAPPRSGLMLGFCGYPRRTIETAVARLAKAVG